MLGCHGFRPIAADQKYATAVYSFRYDFEAAFYAVHLRLPSRLNLREIPAFRVACNISVRHSPCKTVLWHCASATGQMAHDSCAHVQALEWFRSAHSRRPCSHDALWNQPRFRWPASSLSNRRRYGLPHSAFRRRSTPASAVPRRAFGYSCAHGAVRLLRRPPPYTGRPGRPRS